MKTILFAFVASFTCLTAIAQEGFKFELKIEPNKTYTTQMESQTNGTIDFKADETLLEQMKANGVETPMKMEQESTMILVSKTGEKNENGDISANMSYETIASKTVVNGEPIDKPNPLDDMQIIGHYDAQNIFKIDSVIGSNVTDQLRSTITQTMENVQKQIDFPKEELKIGDTFDNEIPMSIPMQGLNSMDIIINSTYLLTDVSKGIAYFDVDQAITLDSEQEQMKLSASGSGKGVCEFSIDDNYLIKYTSELPITMNMEMNAMLSLKMEMDTKTSMSVKIE